MKHFNFRKQRSCFFTVITLFCCLLMILPACAGEGDGSGGGHDQPLSLVSSSVADGQKGVTPSRDIKLTFSKNVVNMAVRDNNKQCFGLSTDNGTAVPIEVRMVDDQINPEGKRNITVVPKQKLETGTAYILKISPDLQAKSGVTLGKQVALYFATAGVAKTNTASASTAVKADSLSTSETKQEEAQEQQQETIGTDDAQDADIQKEDLQEETDTDAAAQEATADAKVEDSNSKSSKIIIPVVILLAVAAAGYIWSKRKKANVN